MSVHHLTLAWGCMGVLCTLVCSTYCVEERNLGHLNTTVSQFVHVCSFETNTGCLLEKQTLWETHDVFFWLTEYTLYNIIICSLEITHKWLLTIWYCHSYRFLEYCEITILCKGLIFALLVLKLICKFMIIPWPLRSMFLWINCPVMWSLISV